MDQRAAFCKHGDVWRRANATRREELLTEARRGRGQSIGSSFMRRLFPRMTSASPCHREYLRFFTNRYVHWGAADSSARKNREPSDCLRRLMAIESMREVRTGPIRDPAIEEARRCCHRGQVRRPNSDAKAAFPMIRRAYCPGIPCAGDTWPPCGRSRKPGVTRDIGLSPWMPNNGNGPVAETV